VNSKRFEDLARRKQALIARAAHERAELGVAYENLCSSFNINQVLFGIGHTLKAHPLITAGISSVLVSGMAGKLLRGAGQAVALSRLALPLWSWLKSRRGSS
jgi:hypothetical protein